MVQGVSSNVAYGQQYANANTAKKSNSVKKGAGVGAGTGGALMGAASIYTITRNASILAGLSKGRAALAVITATSIIAGIGSTIGAGIGASIGAIVKAVKNNKNNQ